MNELVNTKTTGITIATLIEEEEYLRLLHHNDRTIIQQQWLDGIDAYVADPKEYDPVVHVDEVPYPFQFPPGARKKLYELPDGYMYYAECHLHWHVVYTVNISTMEIIGVSDSENFELTNPSVAQCRDGNCKRSKYMATSYFQLVHQRTTLWKLEEDEKKRTTSFVAYGAAAFINEDTFGVYIDFGAKLPNGTGCLTAGIIYCRQFCVSTSSTVAL